jgi:hypothetical protein
MVAKHQVMVIAALIIVITLACSCGEEFLSPKEEKQTTKVEQTTNGTLVPTETPFCAWYQTGVRDALSTGGGDPGRSAERDGDQIHTSYTFGGNLDCADQTFFTTHSWNMPGDWLVKGQEVKFDLLFDWELHGEPDCTSLITGGYTSISIGDFNLKAERSRIVVSSEPEGDELITGTWTVGGGSPGDKMEIVVSGISGSLGGSIYYNYEWMCE